MAVALEFIDFIVPVKIIEAKYPGGWAQCLKDHADLIGGCVWHDDHLFRDGAMSASDIEALVEAWAMRGLTPFASVDGKRVWHDCCVTEHMAGGPTLPCSWIEIAEDGLSAYLKGTDPGPIVGRAQGSV